MNLIEITNEIESLKDELSAKEKAFKAESESLKNQISRLEKERNIVSDGLDLDLIKIAEDCAVFMGDPGKVQHGSYSDQNRSSVRSQAIQDAICIIAKFEDPLRVEYIGVKNYSGFGDQREDHRYRMGPRHGSIVFEIGRRKPASGPMTKEQREACIYYLLNWKKIYEAKQKAA